MSKRRKFSKKFIPDRENLYESISDEGWVILYDLRYRCCSESSGDLVLAFEIYNSIDEIVSQEYPLPPKAWEDIVDHILKSGRMRSGKNAIIISHSEIESRVKSKICQIESNTYPI